MQRTSGNHKYTAKSAKQPCWARSKRKPPATFRMITAALPCQWRTAPLQLQ